MFENTAPNRGADEVKEHKLLDPKKLLLLIIIGFFVLFGSGVRETSAAGPHEVRLTWMSMANWLFEIGSTRIVMNGYFSRIPRSIFIPSTGTTVGPVTPDVAAVQSVIDSLGGNKRVDFILTGHSHFDHSLDTAVWAKLTDAHIIGSQTTCFQAFAQGIPPSQCTIVEGGEVFDLGSGVTVRVVRWHHSGAPGSTNQIPLELNVVPTPDPSTGGLSVGTWEDFRNGGGARGYLFTVDNPGGPISWFFADTGSAGTFNDPVIVFDGPPPFNFVNVFPAPSVNLDAAMADAGLDSVDLYIGTGFRFFVGLAISILDPKAFIPHHWDGIFLEFFAGLPFSYGTLLLGVSFGDPCMADFLEGEGVVFLPQLQYMDEYRLDANGITVVPNHNVKQKLGFPDVEDLPPPADCPFP